MTSSAVSKPVTTILGRKNIETGFDTEFSRNLETVINDYLRIRKTRKACGVNSI